MSTDQRTIQFAIIDEYLNKKCSAFQLLNYGIEKDEDEFVANFKFFETLLKENIVSSSELIEFLRNKDCLACILSNTEFLTELQESHLVSQSEIDLLTTTHQVQDCFTSLFDQPFDDAQQFLDEVAESHNISRTEAMSIFSKAASREMYSFYKYGGGHSLIRSQADYNPSGMRSSSGGALVFRFLELSYQNDQIDCLKDILTSFLDQLELQRFQFNSSTVGLIEFVAKHLLEKDDKFIQLLFEFNSLKLIDGILSLSYSGHSSNLHRDNKIDDFQEKLFEIRSVLTNYSKTPSQELYAVYDELQNNQKLKQELKDFSENDFLTKLSQSLFSSFEWCHRLGYDSLFDVLDKKNILKKEIALDLILDIVLHQSVKQYSDYNSIFNLVYSSNLFKDLEKDHKLTDECFRKLVEVVRKDSETGGRPNFQDFFSLTEDLVMEGVLSAQADLKLYFENSTSDMRAAIYSSGFLLDFMYIEKMFSSFPEIVDSAKNDENFEGLLQNTEFFKARIDFDDLTQEDLRYLLNKIDNRRYELDYLCRNTPVVNCILNEFVLNKEDVDRFNMMIENDEYRREDLHTIFDFIEEYNKNNEKILKLNELNKYVYNFDLDTDQRLKLIEVLRNNEVAQNRLTQIIDNHVESNYDFESLMSHLKKPEKKNLINV